MIYWLLLLRIDIHKSQYFYKFEKHINTGSEENLNLLAGAA